MRKIIRTILKASIGGGARPYAFDKEHYRARHLVENMFAKLKQMRAFATRYDKLKRNYKAMVAMACGVLWVRVLAN